MGMLDKLGDWVSTEIFFQLRIATTYVGVTGYQGPKCWEVYAAIMFDCKGTLLEVRVVQESAGDQTK